MKKQIHISAVVTLLLLGCAQSLLHAQAEVKKVTFVGAARAQFYGDHYLSHSEEDTVTTAKLNSGNTLVDLGIQIRPNQNMEIQGMVRIRNDYGGFWGAGVSFDVRQLYVKGVAAGIVRYQLGDINYRMTKYTLWNNDQELISTLPFIFSQQTDVVNYDHFYYNDHSWRQQGGSAEMGWAFNKWIQEINLSTVATRVKTSNFSDVNDRLFSGISLELVQSKSFRLGWNYVNTFDIAGTSRSAVTYHQPVMTLTGKFTTKTGSWNHSIEGEAGKSRSYYKELSEAPEWKGNFGDVQWKMKSDNSGWNGSIQAKYVSSGFRSTGAQTKRVDYNNQVTAFQRIGNDQVVRPINMMDMMRESGLYTMQLQTQLMAFAPQYDNITPYGEATPNRQAVVLNVGYEQVKSVISGRINYYLGSEVRGEGTNTPRDFQRLEGQLNVHFNNMMKDQSKESVLSVKYRADQTSRSGTDAIPTVDLKTDVLTVGLDHEWKSKWHAMLGFQLVQYSGFEFKSVRDNYGEIYGFDELKLKGKEQVASAGMKYVFNETSFLSVQYYQFMGTSDSQSVLNYGLKQWMLLYQIKF